MLLAQHIIKPCSVISESIDSGFSETQEREKPTQQS